MNHSVFVSRARRLAASFFLIVLLCACGGDKPDAMLASARDYLAKNDPKAAVIQLKNALQNNPDLPEARYLLGLALLRGGNAVGGETELRKALALKHPQELVLPSLAQALLAQRQYKKLTEEFSQIELSQAAAQANLKTSMAAALAAQGKTDLSLAALKAALQADSKYTPARILQARVKAGQRDLEGALAIVEAVIAEAPLNPEAWQLKGDIQRNGKGNTDEALASYRKALEVKPNFVEGHTGILITLLGKGKLDEAAKQMDLLKKVAPDEVLTKYFETLLAYQKKDFKLARDLSQQLMKLAPENPTTLQLAGAVELQVNSLKQAESYLTKGLQAAPDSAVIRRLLVDTYLRSGQLTKALAALQPAL